MQRQRDTEISAADWGWLGSVDQAAQWVPSCQWKECGECSKRISAQFEQRLTFQSSRIDTISEAVERSQKTTEDNIEMLQNLLIGVENMGDNLKQFT